MTSRMERSPVIQVIQTALTPYVGQLMARTSVEGHCKRLGLDMSRLEGAGMEQLLQQIALGLNIFIGREKSQAVMSDLRASLGRERR